MAKSKSDGNNAVDGDKANKKRSAAEEHEEGYKKFKKAKPSICKAAEELVCPILQGLPIDPVTAEDVSFMNTSYIVLCTYRSLVLHVLTLGMHQHILFPHTCMLTYTGSDL